MVPPPFRRRRVTSMLYAAGGRCRSRSLTAALVVVVLGVLGAGVAVHAGAPAQRANVDVSSGLAHPSSLPSSLASSSKPVVRGKRAMSSGAARRLTRRGALGRPQRPGRQQRLRSRWALRGASRAQMLKAGRRHFGEVFSERLFDGKHPDPGMTVVGYRGDTRAMVKDAKGHKLLMKTTLPLRARAANGKLAPVDLSLRESTATFTTANSNADVQIAKDPAGGIRFVDKDFSIAATGASLPQSDGVPADGRVVFDDADASGSNVSFVAVPKPTGVEVGWLLGTADAPESYALKLDLPEGARVRRTQTDDPIPGDPPRTFEIVGQAGKSLAYITPPMTLDSDGVDVASSMRVVGRDRLVVDVKHHGKDLRFPLFVDPEVIVQWGYPSWEGWSTYQVPATPTRVASDYNHNYYGWALNHLAYYPNGPYMSMPTNTWFNMGTSRGFEYRAPAGTTVSRASFGGMSHSAIWPTGNHNMWWQGILNSARNAWHHVWTGYHSACCGYRHDFSGGTSEQNYANIGIGATAPNYQGYLWSGTNKAWLVFDWSNVYLTDLAPPQLTSPRPADQNWSTTTSRTQTVTGSDVGTGVWSFRLTGPGIDKTVSGIGGHATNIQYTPAEGSHEYTLTAIDRGGNTSSPHRWTEKIDRSKPTITSVAGALYDARTRSDDHRFEGLYRDAYELQVRASDAGSGVTETEIYVDGASQRSRGGYASSGAVNWTLRPDDYADGHHVVKIVARDAVAPAGGTADGPHVTTIEHAVTVDRRGDIYRAGLTTGDLDAGGALASQEWTRLGAWEGRSETDGEITTRGIVPCPGDQTRSCGQVRQRVTETPDTQQQDDDIYSVKTGDRVDDPQLEPVSVLTMHEPPGSLEMSGPIADAAQPWQRLPPAHGTQYQRYTSEQTTENGSETEPPRQYTLKTWIDQGTRLPIKQSAVFADGTAGETFYFDYDLARRETSEVPSTLFAVAEPPSPDSREETEMRTAPPHFTTARDKDTAATFAPMGVGPSLDLGSLLCLAKTQKFVSETRAPAPSPADAVAEQIPQGSSAAITAVDASYVLSSGTCAGPATLLNLLFGVDTPTLTVSTYAANSAAARDWVNTYRSLVAANPGRPGFSLDTRLIGLQLANIYTVPYDDSELAALVEIGSVIVTIKGPSLVGTSAAIAAATALRPLSEG